MARKRMISPSMWESLSFSELSDFSKLVFISLISHADDEGRGMAKAATVTNVTFPNDENRRVADVKKALSEIALKMSVQFYSVDGREYYAMTNWLDYQKIDKPTKSKLPPPPFVGERGSYTQNEKFDDYSGSTRGAVGESSPPNIIEDNRIEDNNTSNSACAREKNMSEFEIRFKAFCKRWGIVVDSYSSLIADFDFDKLDKAYSESRTYLQDKDGHPFAQSLDWIIRNYQTIIGGRKFKDKTVQSDNRKQGIIDRWEAVAERYAREENDNDEDN